MSLAPMPPLVPAYNKWMGGVDRTNQRSRYYSLDHRCSRPWMRIFLHLFDVTISNAYILYKHNCRSSSTSKVKTALEFCEELVEDCLENFNSRKRKRGSFTPSTGRIHEVVKVEQVGLKSVRRSLLRMHVQHVRPVCVFWSALADSTKDSCFNINTATCTCGAMHA